MSKLCFFYGTLKRGHYNYERFKEGLTYKHDTAVRGFSLVQSNPYYPHAVIKEGGVVYGEVHEVTDEVFEYIDGMEKGADYIPIEVETDSEARCVMYICLDKTLDELEKFSMFDREE